MTSPATKRRVLIADDDDRVIACYTRAFASHESRRQPSELERLDAMLFSSGMAKTEDEVTFDVVTCSQGDDAIALARRAIEGGERFDVVILDIRMPPGISGVDAGIRIRELDPDAVLIFVTGFSDTSEEELLERIPPRSKLRYLTKPMSFRKLVTDIAAMVKAA